jgi:hypothetical protein
MTGNGNILENNSSNGPDSTWAGGSFPLNPNITKIQEQAQKGDPAAQELLVLMDSRKYLENQFLELKKESSSIGVELNQYKTNLERVNNFMIGVVIALAIAFFFLLFDQIKDKDLYSNYNNTYTSLIDRSVEQDFKIKDIENSLEIIKIKNYLK